MSHDRADAIQPADPRAADQIAQFRRFAAVVIPTAGAFAVLEAVAWLAFRDPGVGLTAIAIALFGLWMAWVRPRMSRMDPAVLVSRIAVGILGVIVVATIGQPVFASGLSSAVLIAVVVALPHLRGSGLLQLIVISWCVAVFMSVASEILQPWGSLPVWVAAILRTASMATTFGLVLGLLWQFSNRLKGTARELGSLVALSSDLAQTLDPRRIGDMMARHLAEATGADECGICYWDAAGDRVLTYGYYPPERRDTVDESYALGDYPATRRVLTEHVELTVLANDPNADPAEVAYLHSIGMAAMVMLPLVAKGQAVGAVELYARQPQRFDSRRLGLGRLLVGEAAIALDNARLYEELRHQAFHDGLTGLANRGLFADRVEHALARAARTQTPLAVLFLDLDDFKTVNDRFGHSVGDQLLRMVGERVVAILRPGDTAARLGGDEFAILLEDISGPDEARLLAERIIGTVRAPFRLGKVDAIVGASLGIALSGPGSDRAPDLLRNADFAMYRAKSSGKGRFEIFEPTMREGIAERSELEALIPHAVERNELRLQYQPIVELATGTIVGVEALVRWHPAGRRMLMPSAFIALAEETGHIVPIGRWVLEEACRQARRSQEQIGQPEFGMSINLSARQFQHPGLVSEVLGALRAAGVDPGSLTLEITESVLMQHTASTIEKLAQLRALGVRLAIDDFGTGYSSLSYLERFPVDILKIDRSFVDGFGAQREGPVLARAIVELGRALDLEVIAEGIERAEQLVPLRALDCRFGQGYLFARPLDPEALSALLAGPALHRGEGLVALRPEAVLPPEPDEESAAGERTG